MSANTFIELNDTPSNYNNADGKYLRVLGQTIRYETVTLQALGDTQIANLSNNDLLAWNSSTAKWEPVSSNLYVAGNGVSIDNFVVSVDIDTNSGLTFDDIGVALSNTGVVAGTYGNVTHTAQITVDAQGRISNVAEIDTHFVQGISGTSGEIIVTRDGANVDLELSATGIDAGVYGNSTHIPSITVDRYGRISNISVLASSGGGGDGSGVEGVLDVIAGAGLTGGGSNSTVTIDLANSGVTAGAYGNSTSIPQIFVDQYGRITSISTAEISLSGGGNIASVNAGAGLTGGGSSPIVSLSISDTGVDAGIYGNTTHVPQFSVNSRGQITDVNPVEISAGVTELVVGGNSLIGAVKLVAGDTASIQHDEPNNSIIINSIPSASGAQVERFKVNYSSSGSVVSISNVSTNISNVIIDNAISGEVTIQFDNYNYPPASIQMYGYDYPQNQYVINTVDSTMTKRIVPGGGSSGFPTAFGSFTEMKLRLGENETGASRDFGSTTHAWIQFVMMG
jgi:hypothetical protein